MPTIARRAAVVLAGYATYINMYSPQALLPSLAREFGVGAATISLTMTMGALAVAMTAPFSGAVADVLGRKRVIVAAMTAVGVPTLMMALAPDVATLVFWRFVQGLLLPYIFVVTIAYIGEEWPTREVAAIAGLYTSGASLGGFSGRFLVGIMADLVGWRTAHVCLALLSAAAAGAVAAMLPRERGFVRSENLGASMRHMLRHLREPQLLATYAVGFGTLFNFIATFTYVSFRLAAEPYGFSPSLLGAVFLVYLIGSAVTPLTGRAVARFGRRGFILAALAGWAGGIVLTLSSSLVAIVAGLAVCSTCGLICQAVSTGYVTVTARAGRSSAIGLYVTAFYVGGGFGGLLPGLAWDSYGWPACVALVLAMLAIMAGVVRLIWTPLRP
jgi:YNFM family putative membrane transporter